MDRARPGGEWLLEGPSEVPAVWGAGHRVAWAKGEPLMIAAPTGAGKTTLAQQLLLARIGLGERALLGLPVVTDQRPVLYVAADRPAQARRSLRRMIDPNDSAVLDDQLLVHDGPLPWLLNGRDDQDKLVRYALHHGVGTIVIDSLKDVATGLSDDLNAGLVARSLQMLVAEGIEVVVLHHCRKSQEGNRRPKSIDDVYGNYALTACQGSVVFLYAENPGDAVVDLIHLKQPADSIGPLKIHHDHMRGRSTVDDGVVDVVAEVAKTPTIGITVKRLASRMFGTDEPSRNQIENARRRLEEQVIAGRLVKEPGDRTTESRYLLPRDGDDA